MWGRARGKRTHLSRAPLCSRPPTDSVRNGAGAAGEGEPWSSFLRWRLTASPSLHTPVSAAGTTTTLAPSWSRQVSSDPGLNSFRRCESTLREDKLPTTERRPEVLPARPLEVIRLRRIFLNFHWSASLPTSGSDLGTPIPTSTGHANPPSTNLQWKRPRTAKRDAGNPKVWVPG